MKRAFIHTRTPLAPSLIGTSMMMSKPRIAGSLPLRTHPWLRKLPLRQLRARFMTSLRFLQRA
jgi:hypothetical protein